ncbi:hypothetical protein CFR72_05820 [Gluconacetobacter entanii]|uniref:Uncharacterized protein n=1 Tax=Gluconacetobacter entanii TaxID=108528 RepID=A0A318PYZ2_9PROT|nr:hypothetical protein CFR72_05820 [Gluconacetobacter entanii]
MFTSGNTSPCHHSLHLFAKTDESQQAGIVQKLSDRALKRKRSRGGEFFYCVMGVLSSYALPTQQRTCHWPSEVTQLRQAFWQSEPAAWAPHWSLVR